MILKFLNFLYNLFVVGCMMYIVYIHINNDTIEILFIVLSVSISINIIISIISTIYKDEDPKKLVLCLLPIILVHQLFLCVFYSIITHTFYKKDPSGNFFIITCILTILSMINFIVSLIYGVESIGIVL
jgi:hypothetical protein